MRLGMILPCDDAGFAYAKQKGLDFIEADKNHPEMIEEFVSQVDSINQNIQKNGIDISAVGRWGAQVQKEGKPNRDVLAQTEALFDAAVKVGAKTFICGCNYDDSVSLYRNYTCAIEIFGAFLDRARGKNINIAVYNCEWGNFVNTPEQWRVVLGELPDLKIKYDPAHAIGRHADYLSEIHDWADRIAYVHLKGSLEVGSVGWVDFPPAGMDQVQWGPMLSLLRAKGYDGDLALEPHSAVWKKGSELGERGIDWSIRYFNHLLMRGTDR